MVGMRRVGIAAYGFEGRYSGMGYAMRIEMPWYGIGMSWYRSSIRYVLITIKICCWWKGAGSA